MRGDEQAEGEAPLPTKYSNFSNVTSMNFFRLFFWFYAAHTAFAITPIDSLPHSDSRYTQGLFWKGDELWESTGLEGHSKIYRMNKKGETTDSVSMRGRHFGEGIASVGNKLLWLTWRSQVGFILEGSLHNEELKFIGQFPLYGEGWGLTVWNNQWLMSDGSSSLFVLSLGDMHVVKKIAVKFNGVPVRNLNELEAVGDTLFANVWYSDSIAVIHIPTGTVTRWLDISALAQAHRKAHHKAEVLNGIAFDGKNLWITGKFWSEIYKIE
ncbi:glutamine cyclotransferase [Fibrobacterales bacterium]|nr:glutamine cyclotransferase [Fibrobacterales bacterium]